jgi:catechol 2,3-dioxygenase-like lactoylglutathione lyase family enzyme
MSRSATRKCIIQEAILPPRFRESVTGSNNTIAESPQSKKIKRLQRFLASDTIHSRHGKGDDDHGQICSEGQAEQESSEGTEPSAANDVGLQPRYVNRLMTHCWGQKVIRFYDPDGNLIEVGTPM